MIEIYLNLIVAQIKVRSGDLNLRLLLSRTLKSVAITCASLKGHRNLTAHDAMTSHTEQIPSRSVHLINLMMVRRWHFVKTGKYSVPGQGLWSHIEKCWTRLSVGNGNGCLNADVADSIHAAPSARQAKGMASMIDGNVEQDWRDANGHIKVISDMLGSKSMQVATLISVLRCCTQEKDRSLKSQTDSDRDVNNHRT